jgi:hypothetical protein
MVLEYKILRKENSEASDSTTMADPAAPTAPTKASILFAGLNTSGVVELEPEEDLDA